LHYFTASSSASASAFFPAFPSICLPQYLHLPGLTHQLKPTMSCTPSGLNLHLGHGNIICEPPAPEPPKRSRAAPVAEHRWQRSQKDHGDIIAGRDQQIQIGTGKRRTVNEIHESFSCLMIVPSPTRILRIMCSSLQKQTCFSCPSFLSQCRSMGNTLRIMVRWACYTGTKIPALVQGE